MTNRRIKNKKEKRLSNALLFAIILVIAAIIAAGIGIHYAYTALDNLYSEQCRIEDRELDVVITTGKMIHPDVITYMFGLTNGANLAKIPLAEMREKTLKETPSVKDIKIERRLPNRLIVEVIEREPVARIGMPKGSRATGLVVDREGVVFKFFNNTSSLPMIREATEPLTQPGKKLTGFSAAALRLVEVASRPELADLRIQEIDTSHSDYLMLKLGNQDRVKLAWDHMNEDTRLSRDSLAKQLKRVLKAINVNITPLSTLWIATDWGSPGRVWASDRSGNN